MSLHCWLVFHKLDWVCRARKQPKGEWGRAGAGGGSIIETDKGGRRLRSREEKGGARCFGKPDYGETRGRVKSERGNDPNFVFPKLPKTGFSHREGRQQSLAVFCHHGVSGVNTGLTWQDRCWLLALRPGSGDNCPSGREGGSWGGALVLTNVNDWTAGGTLVNTSAPPPEQIAPRCFVFCLDFKFIISGIWGKLFKHFNL